MQAKYDNNGIQQEVWNKSQSGSKVNCVTMSSVVTSKITNNRERKKTKL